MVSTSDSTLGVEAEVLQPARRRGTHKTQIRKAAPDPSCDCYAPHPKRCKCVDPQGYHRPAHEYLVDTRRGRRCCWCNLLERAVKA